MQISAELYEFVIKVVDDRVREIKVTREDFNALKQVVEELVQAQKKTEQRVEELAQAQKKTEERLGRVEAAVEELAQAQKKTEQRVEELAQAQKRTEEELCSLVREHAKTREMVAGLSDTVGYGLENQAYKALPRLLERDFDLKIKDRLARRYIVYKDGKEDKEYARQKGIKVYYSYEF